MKTVKYISIVVLALLSLVSCKGNLDPDNPNKGSKASLPKGISIKIEPGADNSANMHFTDAVLSGNVVLVGNPELLPSNYYGNLSAVLSYGTNPEELSTEVNCTLGDPVTDYWSVSIPYEAKLIGLSSGLQYYFSVYAFYGGDKPFKSDPVKFFTFTDGPVDLGLKSGLQWASCNLGATYPEDSGAYYAWAEVSPKAEYDWATYAWCVWEKKTFGLTKYCNFDIWGWEGFTDNLYTIESSDDAATAKLGAGWRTPTAEDWTELNVDCDWQAATINGTQGWLVRSKANTEDSNKLIFLPCTGYIDGTEKMDTDTGVYWSSSVYASSCFQALGFVFNASSEHDVDSSHIRTHGLTIRPVKAK